MHSIAHSLHRLSSILVLASLLLGGQGKPLDTQAAPDPMVEPEVSLTAGKSLPAQDQPQMVSPMSVTAAEGETMQWYCWPDGSPDPCHNHLYDVQVWDADNAWAVGQMGTALRWNDGLWYKVETPTETDLLDVDLLGPDDIWAVGEEGTILHGNGEFWELMQTPITQTLNAVDMLSPLRGWAVGEQGVILYWDGSQWSIQQAPDLSQPDLNAISMLLTTNGYAVGDSGAIFHYDGEQWISRSGYPFPFGDMSEILMVSDEEIYISALCSLTRYSIYTTDPIYIGPFCNMSYLGPDNIWGVGVTGTYPSNGTGVLHWDGTNYAEMPYFASSWPIPKAVAMISASDGWVVSEYGAIARWDGYAFNLISGNAQYGNWNSVDLAADGQGWAVGQNGRVAYWDGSNLRAAPSATSESLWDVSVLPDGRAWAVGDKGVILHYNGVSWQLQDSDGVEANLLSVDMVSATDGWAAGGEIFLHWNGLTWTRFDQPFGCWISDLDLLSADFGWAVGWDSGGYGCALRYIGGDTWHYTGDQLGLSSNPKIKMVSETNGWLLSDDVYRWNGQSWASIDLTLPYSNGFIAIDMVSASDGWLQTNNGLYRWNGVDWLPWHGGENLNFTAIAMHSATAGVAVAGNQLYTWDGAAWRNHVTYRYSLGFMDSTSSTDVWATTGYGELLHFNGSKWAGVPNNHGTSLIEALDATHAWSAGYCGGPSDCVSAWEGVNWERIGYIGYLNDISAVSENEVWFAGGEALLRWDGENWEVMRYGVYPFCQLEMVSASEGYALGTDDDYTPASYTWDGSQWLTHRLNTTAALNSLAAAGPGAVWMGGWEYEVLPDTSLVEKPKAWRWTGSGWLEEPVEGEGSIATLDMLSANEGWAVGRQGGIWHYNGVSWQKVESPVKHTLYGLTMISSQEGWATGEGGMLLRYGPPPEHLPADPAQSSLTVSPLSVPADGVSQAQITVTLRGFDGAPLAGKHVLLFSNRPGEDILTQPRLPTDANGVTHGAAASHQPGTSTFLAVVMEGSVTLGPSPVVTFTNPNLATRQWITNLWQTSDAQYAKLALMATDTGDLGDYYRNKIDEEDLKWTLDLALLMLDGAFKIDGLEEEAKKVGFPGIGDRWNPLKELKAEFSDAGKMWNANLELAYQENSWQAFANMEAEIGIKYFVARYLNKQVEDITEDELYSFYEYLIDTYTPSQYADLAAYYAEDVEAYRALLNRKTHDTLAVLPALTPAQEALYTRDLRGRFVVPVDMYTQHYQTYNMLVGLKDVLEKEGANDWDVFFQEILSFLAKFAAKTFLTGTMDGIGPLLFDGADFAFDSAVYFQQRSAMMQAYSEVPSLLYGLPASAQKIYLNANSAYRYILENQPVVPAQATVLSKTNYTEGNAFAGWDGLWEEKNSYTEVFLTNTGSTETTYSLYGQYGYTLKIFNRPWAYIPTATEAAITLPPGGTGAVRVYYKQDTSGASPDPDANVFIRILGTNEWGTYHITTEQVAWNNLVKVWETQRDGISGASQRLTAPLAEDEVVVSRPIDLYVGPSLDSPTYQARVLVSNPFSETITAQISLPLPPEMQVLDTSGFVYPEMVRWSLRLKPRSSQTLALELASSAALGDPVAFAPAQMVIHFDDQPLPLTTQSNAVLADGLWPLEVRTQLGAQEVGQPIPVSVTLTNTYLSEVAGSLVLTLLDGKGGVLDVQEAPFSLPAQGSKLVNAQLPAQSAGAYVFHVEMKMGDNLRRYSQMVIWLDREQLYLPLVVN